MDIASALELDRMTSIFECRTGNSDPCGEQDYIPGYFGVKRAVHTTTQMLLSLPVTEDSNGLAPAVQSIIAHVHSTQLTFNALVLAQHCSKYDPDPGFENQDDRKSGLRQFNKSFISNFAIPESELTYEKKYESSINRTA